MECEIGLGVSCICSSGTPEIMTTSSPFIRSSGATSTSASRTPPPSTSSFTTIYLYLHSLLEFILAIVLFLYLVWGLGREMVLVMTMASDTTVLVQQKSALNDAIFISRISQILALSEIFQALFGMIKSSLPIQITQNIGRCFVVFCAVSTGDSVSLGRCASVGLLLMAWSLGDMVRYAFYVVKARMQDSSASVTGGSTRSSTHLPSHHNTAITRNASPRKGSLYKAVEWLRYNSFIVLYPMGMFGEICNVIYAGFYQERYKMWMKIFLVVVIVAYPTLYLYMLRQRQKRQRRLVTKSASGI